MQTPNLVAQLLAQSLIEARQWFVEQQQRRIEDESARKGYALTLAAGELMRAAALKTLERDHRQRIGDSLLALIDRSLTQPQPIRHVVCDGHVREKAKVLENGVARASIRRQRRHVEPAKEDAARRRLNESANHLQDRALARTGRAEQGYK